jgi:hypothetical protein
MAKVIKYDVSGVEESGGGGVQPRAGVYPAKIVICRQREEKTDGSPANDIEVALNLGGDYAWVYTYIGLSEAADWKLAEFTRALGLKEKGQFDPDKIVGKMIKVKINPDSYDGEYRGRAARLMKAARGDKLAEASDVDGDEPDAEEEEAADDEKDSGQNVTGAFTPTREDESDDEVGSYDDWADEDLAAEVEDRGLTVGGGRGKKRDKHIKALREDDESAEAEPEAEEEASGTDDYDEWTADELIAEATERQLELPRKPRGSGAEDRYKEKLIELLRADDGENPF